MKHITKLERFGGSGMSFRYGGVECRTDQDGIGLRVGEKWYGKVILPSYNIMGDAYCRRRIHQIMQYLEAQS